MNFLLSLFGVLVSSAVIENMIFARAVGVDHIIQRSRSYRFILFYGLGVAAVSCLAAIPIWWVGEWFGQSLWWGQVRPVAVLLAVTASNLLLMVAAALSGRVKPLRLIDQGAIYGTAFAIVMFALASKLSFVASVFYCFGASAGLSAAMVLVHSGRNRLELCELPRSFSGLPITMIYIGILSLAIYGLIGHQLPT